MTESRGDAAQHALQPPPSGRHIEEGNVWFDGWGALHFLVYHMPDSD